MAGNPLRFNNMPMQRRNARIGMLQEMRSLARALPAGESLGLSQSKLMHCAHVDKPHAQQPGSKPTAPAARGEIAEEALRSRLQARGDPNTGQIAPEFAEAGHRAGTSPDCRNF